MDQSANITASMKEARTICYRELSFFVDKGVFYPGEKSSCGSHFFTDKLLEQEPEGSMIEIGCGSGLTGLALTKLKNLERLTAADASDAAVQCTERNSVRLGIAEKVAAIQSNVFDAIPETRANIIYWNTPWLYLSRNRKITRGFDPCMYDQGYAHLNTFIRDSRKFLRADGRRFLGSGRGANTRLMWDMCKQNGCEPSLVAEMRVEGQQTLALYELVTPTNRTCVQLPSEGVPCADPQTHLKL